MNRFKTEIANQIHNNKYDYTKIVYKNARSKVEIICPLHGSFWQSYENHTYRKNGCPKCKGIKLRCDRQFTFQQWVDKAKEIHHNRYEYLPQIIDCAHTDITMICKVHGPFVQNFNNHVFGKNGCPKCGYNISSQEKQWLDSLNIPYSCRQKYIKACGKSYKVDAYVAKSNTIYEFFGYFWHGHPNYFSPNTVNPKCKKTYGELYQKTLDKIYTIQNAGYNLIYIWG